VKGVEAVVAYCTCAAGGRNKTTNG